MKTKTVIIFLTLVMTFTTSISAQQLKDGYLDKAHNNNMLGCDTLINDNFSFFNYLNDSEYHIEVSTFQAPDDSFKSIRYMFNSDYVDPILGDLTIVQSKNFCQSFLNISMIDNNVTCDVWKQVNGNQWNNIEKSGVINWASNGKYKALFQSVNDVRGCQVNFYITNISNAE